NACLVWCVASTHQCPVAAVIFPEVVEIVICPRSGTVHSSAKKPKRTASVGPGGRTIPRSGLIRPLGYTLITVHSGLIDNVRSTYPRPIAAVEFPEIIQISQIPIDVISVSAEQPQGALFVDPRC